MRWSQSTRPSSSRPSAKAEALVVDTLLAGSGLPRSEALLLLAHASGRSRERLIAGSDDRLDAVAVDRFRSLAGRRAAGEPIAYLVGHREFFGRRFTIDASVLIPRPETELLVELALRWIDARARPPRVLDLGTGSGIVAVTLSLERPSVEIVATDVDEAALRCARGNAAGPGAPVAFLAGDWFAALDLAARFDLVVSNPPYVAADDPHLRRGDLRFEPAHALTDGGDGLQAIRRIVVDAPSRLADDGALMIEHGHDQGPAVARAMREAGFVSVASHRDLAGIERITVGSRAVER